jgi:hypothetical protein
MADSRLIFADGLMEASVTSGVARFTLAQTGADGKPTPAGQLVMPLVQVPNFANALVNLLKQIEAKVKEAQAQQGGIAAPAIAAPTAVSEQPPSVPGAFRFNGG